MAKNFEIFCLITKRPAYNISTRTAQKPPFILVFFFFAVQTRLFAKPLLGLLYTGSFRVLA
jgi:hypothetical protein